MKQAFTFDRFPVVLLLTGIRALHGDPACRTVATALFSCLMANVLRQAELEDVLALLEEAGYELSQDEIDLIAAEHMKCKEAQSSPSAPSSGAAGLH